LRIFLAAGIACVFPVLRWTYLGLSLVVDHDHEACYAGLFSEVVAALFCFCSCSPYTSTSRVRRPYGSPVRLEGLMLIILFNRSDREAAPISFIAHP
jgi:hypothetical protein